MLILIIHKWILINTPAPLVRVLFVSPILWPAPHGVNSAPQQQRIAFVGDRKAQPDLAGRRIEGEHGGIALGTF